MAKYQIVEPGHPAYQSVHGPLCHAVSRILDVVIDEGNARTISNWIEHEDQSMEPLGVTVLDEWTTHGCEAMIVAFKQKHCFTRQWIRQVYKYVFETANKNRMSMVVKASNTTAINMNKALGHVEEGRLRDWFGPGEDAIAFSFLKSDFQKSRWNNKKEK